MNTSLTLVRNTINQDIKGSLFKQNGTPGFQPYHDNPPNQCGLTDLKGERWWKMKRSVTPSFSTPRLKKNVPTMNEAALKVKDTRTIYLCKLYFPFECHSWWGICTLLRTRSL